ncbi:MAG TPA: hypothetical protein VNY80_07940 [Steroidobacteraceae bacterium]|nr:hypothetical protein [Steroidobacteraceae bacterium]
MAEMADALGTKAPGESGTKAWFIALKDFAVDEVVDALDHWLRTKPKMPSPFEIRAILAGRLSDRIEAKAVAEKRVFAAGAHRILSDAERRAGREQLRQVRAMMTAAAPHEPDDWWHALITIWRRGESLVWMQMVNATLAWEHSGRPAEWIPPNIEAQLEREAIQAEGAP